MAKMSGGKSQFSGSSWASLLNDNTANTSDNVRSEKRRKSGDMHTKLTLDDKPLLGDMPKLEEFSTVCCKLCKCPVKTQSVKEHMALRHPDYSAARLREEAERFQVKIMINSIPESLFAAVPSYKSHMLSPVRVTSPVPPVPEDVVDEETAAVVDLYAPIAPVKEEPPEAKRHSLVDDPEVVSSEEQLGAVLSLKTEVPGAFVDILNEFESDAGGAEETAAPVSADEVAAAAPASPAPPPVRLVLPEPPDDVPSPAFSPLAAPAAPAPPLSATPLSALSSPVLPAAPAPAAAASAGPRLPSKAEFKTEFKAELKSEFKPAPSAGHPQVSPCPSPSPSPSRSFSDSSEAGTISDHFAKLRQASGGSLCAKKNRLGHMPRQYDPRKHCGVWIAERSKNCTRVLDCRQHNLDQKSKVTRPVPFKDLLARFKAGKSRDKETIAPSLKALTVRYDPKFPAPEGHPAAGLASPARPGPPGMVTYRNITNSPAFRRERGPSADEDSMPPPAALPPRPARPPPVDASLPRLPAYPQPLAVGGALHLSSRGGCLSLVDSASALRGAFRSLFQPARRGQQSLLKVNQTRAAAATAPAPAPAPVPVSAPAPVPVSAPAPHPVPVPVPTPANGQLPAKRPPEPPGAVVAKRARPAPASGHAAAPAARPAAPQHQHQHQHQHQQPVTLQLQQPGAAAAVNAVLAAAAAATGGGGAARPQPSQPQQPQQQQQQPALLSLQQGGRGQVGLSLGQVNVQPQQLNIQLPKGGLPQNIRLTLPSSAISQLQGISNDAKMIAINPNKVPINRMGQGPGSVSLGQRVARIGAPSNLPVHHLPQQVLGQIQIPRLPGGAGGLTLKVQPQGGLVMRPEPS